MDNRRINFREFYTTGEYKGFRKVKEFRYSGITNIIFSNHKRTISKTGKDTEDVLQKIFVDIDLISVIEN